MKNLAEQLEELGITPKISQETAEEQWRKFAKEYRLVGQKAESLADTTREMVIAIMCGDLQIDEAKAGISIKQFLTHETPGAPKEITYNSPNAKHLAAGGTDAATLSTKWLRIAASLTGFNEGQLTLWLTCRDFALMESIVQLFISA